jgi:NTE family protein
MISFFRLRKKKIGLVLGGGAVRGIAHIGVLQALHDNNIPIHSIAGTSAGSIVGGLFAAGLQPNKIAALLKSLSWSDFAKIQLPKQGLASSEPIENLIINNVGDLTFSDLKIPLTVMATDILSGESVLLNEPTMKIGKAIRASASFPGVFSPTKLNDRHLCDGGASANLPINVARKMGANFIIACDVIPKINLDSIPDNMISLTSRSLDILLNSITNQKNEKANILLNPVTKDINSFQLNKADELIELGKNAMLEQIENLKGLY